MKSLVLSLFCAAAVFAQVPRPGPIAGGGGGGGGSAAPANSLVLSADSTGKLFPASSPTSNAPQYVLTDTLTPSQFSSYGFDTKVDPLTGFADVMWGDATGTYLILCGDMQCTPNVRSVIKVSSDGGNQSQTGIIRFDTSTSLPCLEWTNAANTGLIFVRFSDITSGGVWTTQTVTPVGVTSITGSTMVIGSSDNLAQIIFVDVTSLLIRTVHCTIADCSTYSSPNTGLSGLGSTSLVNMASAIGSDGFASYAWNDLGGTGDIWYAHNNNATGSAPAQTTIVGDGSAGFSSVGLAIASGDRPIIATANGTGVILGECSNLVCGSLSTLQITTDASATSGLALTGADLPLITGSGPQVPGAAPFLIRCDALASCTNPTRTPISTYPSDNTSAVAVTSDGNHIFHVFAMIPQDYVIFTSLSNPVGFDPFSSTADDVVSIGSPVQGVTPADSAMRVNYGNGNSQFMAGAVSASFNQPPVDLVATDGGAGTLPAGKYYYCLTLAVDQSFQASPGQAYNWEETKCGNVASVTVAANHKVTLTWTNVYLNCVMTLYVYRSTDGINFYGLNGTSSTDGCTSTTTFSDTGFSSNASVGPPVNSGLGVVNVLPGYSGPNGGYANFMAPYFGIIAPGGPNGDIVWANSCFSWNGDQIQIDLNFTSHVGCNNNDGAATAEYSLALTGMSITGSGTSYKAPAFISTGTFPTITGCGTISGAAGGSTAGTFATNTTGTCAAAIPLPTAPNGWTCYVQDITKHVATNILIQSASSTTSCTVTGTTASGDVLTFLAIGW